MPPGQQKRRVVAYIDGFNLYYGVLKQYQDYRWLDIKKMVKMLHPHDEIVHVKYFTALVDKDNSKSLKRLRQETYWNALDAVGVTRVEGRLEYRKRTCGVTACSHIHPRDFDTPVEKMTDVNMALQIVDDATTLKPDVMVVFSADTDLIPALKKVRERHQCVRRIYLPVTPENMKYRRVDEYSLVGWDTCVLTQSILQDSLLPNPIHLTSGVSIKSPWYVPTSYEIAFKAAQLAQRAQATPPDANPLTPPPC